MIVVATLAETTWYNYAIGFPFSGPWVEVFNSDVYDNWVNPVAWAMEEGFRHQEVRCMALVPRRIS